MASNILEKNKAYSFKSFTTLPYPDAKNINYSYENSMLNSSMLNNTYSQLVDNDAFIAQQLNQKQAWQIGPTATEDTTKSAVDGAQNGTKFFESLDNPRPYRKVEKALSSSIRTADRENDLGGYVKRFIPFEPSQMFVSYHGTSSGKQTGKTAVVDLSQKLANKSFNAEYVAIDKQGTRQPIEIVATCAGSYSGRLFIGHSWDGNGVPTAHLVMYDGKIQHGSTKVSVVYSIPGFEMAAIAHKRNGNLLVFATCSPDGSWPQSDVYTCSVVSDQIDISTLKRVYSTTSARVNCILVTTKPSKVLLFMSDGAIMSSEDGRCQDYSLYDAEVYDFYDDNGKHWLATSNGLVCNGKVVVSTPYLSPKSICYDNGKLYISQMDSLSLSAMNASTHALESLGEHNTGIVNGIEVVGDFVFAGGTVKTVAKPTNSPFADVELESGTQFPSYALGQAYDNDYNGTLLYAAGLSAGHLELAAFKIDNVSYFDGNTLASGLSTVLEPGSHIDSVFSRYIADTNGYGRMQVPEESGGTIDITIHNFIVFSNPSTPTTKSLYDLTLKKELFSYENCQGIFFSSGIVVVAKPCLYVYSGQMLDTFTKYTINMTNINIGAWKVHDAQVFTTIVNNDGSQFIMLVVEDATEGKGSQRYLLNLSLDSSTNNASLVEGAGKTVLGKSALASDKIVKYGDNYAVLSGDGSKGGKMLCFGFANDLADFSTYVSSLGPTGYPKKQMPSPSTTPQFYLDRNALMYPTGSHIVPGPERVFLSSNYSYKVNGNSSKKTSKRYVFSRTDFVAACGSCGEEVSCISSLIQMNPESFDLIYQNAISCGAKIQNMSFSTQYDAAVHVPSDKSALCVALASEDNDFKEAVQLAPSSIFHYGSSGKMTYGGFVPAAGKIEDAIIEKVNGKQLSVVYSLVNGSTCKVGRWISSTAGTTTSDITIAGSGSTFPDAAKNFTYRQLSNSNSYELLFSAGSHLYKLALGSSSCQELLDAYNNDDDIRSIVAVNVGVPDRENDYDASTMAELTTDLPEAGSIQNFWKIWPISAKASATPYSVVNLAQMSVDTEYFAVVTDNTITKVSSDNTAYKSFAVDKVYSTISSAFTTNIGNKALNERFPLVAFGATGSSSDGLVFITSQSGSKKVPVKVQDSNHTHFIDVTDTVSEIFGIDKSSKVSGFFQDSVDNTWALSTDTTNVWILSANSTFVWSQYSNLTKVKPSNAVDASWPANTKIVPYANDISAVTTDGSDIDIVKDKLSCFAFISGSNSNLSTVVIDRMKSEHEMTTTAKLPLTITSGKPLVAALSSGDPKKPCLFLDGSTNANLGSVQTFTYVQQCSADFVPVLCAHSASYGVDEATTPCKLVQNCSSDDVEDYQKFLVELNDHTVLKAIGNNAGGFSTVWENSNGQIIFPGNSFDGVLSGVVLSNSTLFKTQSFAAPTSSAKLLDNDPIVCSFLSSGYDHKLESLEYDGSNYHLFLSRYAYIGSETINQTLGIVFNGSSQKTIAFTEEQVATPLDPHSVVKVGDGNYVVGCPGSVSNLKYYQPLDSRPIESYLYTTMAKSNVAPILTQAVKDGQQNTFVCANGVVYSSANGSSWSKYLQLPSGASPLSCFALANARSLFGFNGSKLYYVDYIYDLVNDYPEFNALCALTIYEEKKSEIELSISNSVTSHVNAMHTAKNSGSSLSDLNASMPVDFSKMPSAFGSSSSTTLSNYDYIQRIFTGDGSTGEVRARASSPAMKSGRWQEIDLTYIARQWKKNTIELYIYLPTTNTFYIPHVDGAGQCTNQDQSVYANGELVDPHPAHSATHIQIDILSTYFTFSDKNVYENTIKGNSLPLKIYKDGTYTTASDEQHNIYHSLALPSVASYKSSFVPASNGYYTLDYYCFGTDAQAIKIVFKDTQQYFLRKYKTVIYHGQNNMANIQDSDTIQQRLLEGSDIAAIKILWNPFKLDGGIFLGWSQSPTATNPDIDNFGPSKTFSYSTVTSSVVNLYAVWAMYTFGSNDTSITIQNKTAEQTYTVSEVTIDPSITFANNPTLKNKLVVDFGDE